MIMKANMNSTDKLVRFALSIVLIVLYYKQVLSETLGIIALLAALVLTITSLIGYCPIYGIFGWKTNKNKEK